MFAGRKVRVYGLLGFAEVEMDVSGRKILYRKQSYYRFLLNKILFKKPVDFVVVDCD